MRGRIGGIRCLGVALLLLRWAISGSLDACMDGREGKVCFCCGAGGAGGGGTKSNMGYGLAD